MYRQDINDMNECNKYSSLNIDIESHIDSIPDDFFPHNTTTTSIHIKTNGLVHMKSNLFENVINLKHLTIENMEIFETLIRLKLDFRKNKQLNSLTLKNVGSIHNIPLVTGLDKLKVIEITGSSICELGKGIFEGLNDLEVLDLKNNKINKVDVDTFVPLKKLKILDLGSNSLIELPYNIYNKIPNYVEINKNNEPEYFVRGVRDGARYEPNPAYVKQPEQKLLINLAGNKVDESKVYSKYAFDYNKIELKKWIKNNVLADFKFT